MYIEAVRELLLLLEKMVGDHELTIQKLIQLGDLTALMKFKYEIEVPQQEGLGWLIAYHWNKHA